MDLAILSANLRRVRAAKGKSQGEIAAASELSRVGYRNIEAGTTAPRVDSLMRIAEALGVRLEELLVPVRQLRTVRFRADKKMNTRNELLANVATWLDAYNDLENILGEHRASAFEEIAKQLKTDRAGVNRAKKAAALARTAVKLAETDLIRDICGLLEDHGVKVFTPNIASEGFFGLSVGEADGGPAIVVNTWDRLSVERWIFTAAHELGHLIMHADSYDTTQTAEDKIEEKEADTFASYFLLPDRLFNKEYGEARGLRLFDLVMKLKRIFRVSCTSVVYRIASMARDKAAVWAQFKSEYRARTGRELDMTKEPDGLEASEFRGGRPFARSADEPDRLIAVDFVHDRLNRLVRRALEEQLISQSRAAEVLKLSLEDMRELTNSWVAP